MGQDIYLKLRKKDSPKDEYGNKETYAMIKSICGRGPLQDIVIRNLSLYSNEQNEFVVSEDNKKDLENAISELAKERDKVFTEISNAMAEIEKLTLYTVAARDMEAIKEAQTKIALYKELGDPDDFIWGDFFLATHLINLLATAEEMFICSGYSKDDPFREEMEIVIAVSY